MEVLQPSKLIVPVPNTKLWMLPSHARCLDPALQQRWHRDHRLSSQVPATKPPSFSPGNRVSSRQAPDRPFSLLAPAITHPGFGF